MKIRRRTDNSDAVTLFPFLAVLICTMGSLIVLLVVVVQQARASAESYAQQQLETEQLEADKVAHLKREKETFAWKIEMLQQSRQAAAEDLSEKRLQVSHIEDQIRQLKEQLDAHRHTAKEIRSSETADQEKISQEIARLEAELETSVAEVERLRQEIKDRKPSYALVAYDGKNGTKRRPIYIECLSDRIVLQPEGVILTGKDFIAPITDDNPLALALRAKREYQAAVLGGDQKGEPYPLLIVRPNGTRSYAAARVAMRAWDSEFGYELVPADLNLHFPPRDEAIVEVVQKAIDDGRKRRSHLSVIAPRRFGRNSGGATIRASRSGGFVREGGGSGRVGGGRRAGGATIWWWQRFKR